MNMSDLALIPWPMFLLLVAVAVGWVWYGRIHAPLVESYEALKKEEHENIKQLKDEVSNLIGAVVEIKRSVNQNHADNAEIVKSLDDIEKCASTLNSVSSFLNEKEHVLDNNVAQINTRLNELSLSFDNLKNSVFTKKFKKTL